MGLKKCHRGLHFTCKYCEKQKAFDWKEKSVPCCFLNWFLWVLNPKRLKIVVFLCSNPNLELFSDKCDLVSFVFVLMVFILVFLKVVVGRWMIAIRLSLIFHNQGNIVLPCLVTESLRWSTNWNVTCAALKTKEKKKKSQAYCGYNVREPRFALDPGIDYNEWLNH